MKNLGDVVCSIIESNGMFLLAQRPGGKALALKWEFPGGKVKQGESEKEALKREIKEELGIDIEATERLTPNSHSYSSFSINLIPYRCKIVKGKPYPMEHANIAWVNAESVNTYVMAEADLPILEEYLLRILKK
jgi:8-oxo-dGTP diphosphatase